MTMCDAVSTSIHLPSIDDSLPAVCGTLDPASGLPYREFADNPFLARLVDEAMDEDAIRVIVAAYRLGMEDGIDIGVQEGYDLGDDDRYGPWND